MSTWDLDHFRQLVLVQVEISEAVSANVYDDFDLDEFCQPLVAALREVLTLLLKSPVLPREEDLGANHRQQRPFEDAFKGSRLQPAQDGMGRRLGGDPAR